MSTNSSRNRPGAARARPRRSHRGQSACGIVLAALSWSMLSPATSLASGTPPASVADACRPAPAGVARLIEIRPGFHRVEGPLAEFDPCHRSVQLSLPGGARGPGMPAPPLVIIAHGGNGPGRAERELVRRLDAHGVATLLFDAYEMNGFQYRGTSLFLTGTSNESRQRMILKAALGAYHWVLRQTGVDTTRLFIHGLSNGGSVALNMAALVDPAHVRMVFAEGPSPTGIGMPDRIRVPLQLIFGRLDNYGGRAEDDWMATRTDPCAFNRPSPLAAAGTARQCSLFANPSAMTISPQAWGERLRAEGQPVELRFYDDAAHGLLAGPIVRGMRVYGAGPDASTRFGWTGASREAADRYVEDLMVTIRSSAR